MLSENSFHAINEFLPKVTYSEGKLLELFTFLQSQQVSYEIIDDKINHNIKISHNLNLIFASKEIKQKIYTLYTKRSIKFTTYNKNFEINIYYKDENIDYLVDIIQYYISFVAELAKSTVNKVIFTLYLLDIKKVYLGNHILGLSEVNSGEAYTDINNISHISIWRKEELLKSIIHELIHSLHYDYRNDSHDIINYYRNKYNITSKKVNTYEAYTESFTGILHSYLLSKYKYPAGDMNQYELFVSNVGIEKEYALQKASFVLSLNSKPVDMNKFSNVLAYYIIRAEIYNNMDTFLDYCQKNNNNYINIRNSNMFLDYLKKLSKIKQKKQKLKNYYLQNTMKMTCLELDLFRH